MSEEGEYEAKEANINYKAISCEQIPELFLDKLVAKKHFGKFGKITRFILTPMRLSCTVEYETEEQAERAFMNGSNFNGIDFLVNYAEHKVAHVQDTEQWVDPDVQAELEAMAPSTRGFGPTSGSVKSGTFLKSIAKATLQAPPIIRSDMPPPPVSKPVPTAVRSELEAILRRPALTDEDKYRVLDARDKLIRLMTVRQTDIKKAVAAKGTCPDMCPEKERLMREFQRQVSTYEMADNEYDSPSTISHRKAIKEYSRSSADQEVPLSHELRSESVLQMTMLYLMHRIMDLCDDPQTSLADWFHFLWDRTRSIRKDITQQELCSLGGVQLVEQCARFHIHCAARLVAEDPSVFDKKINAENLTKCLQTLKYMYHDLRIKGVECTSEAEFRSYIILLNLGDSNFLWEVKQLPVMMQKSAEIKRAIAFYNALQNNNYVKFFSMIKSNQTSYLSACILLGYFNRLRVRAMEAIIKSHNRGRIEVILPLSYLTRVLGFDDEQAAVSFLTYYGLQCDDIDDRVYLERMSRPSLEYSMERALKLVESKRLVSVGECVFGKILPSPALFEQHEPHSSFDANGLLRPESWTADDQLRGDEAVIKRIKNPAKESTVFKTPELNVFKIPQISPQQHQQQSLFSTADRKGPGRSSSPAGFMLSGNNKKEERATSTLGGFKFVKDEPRSSSPGGFKFGGNIFGGNTAASSSIESSLFKPIQENGSSIFKSTPQQTTSSASIFKIPVNTITDPKTNNNLFKTTLEKPSIAPKEKGNIFGGFTNTDIKPATTSSTSIFGNAAKEAENIFQTELQQKQETMQLHIDSFRKDNVFQNFQNKPEMSIFGGINKTSSSTPLSQSEFRLPSTTSSLKEMEQRRIQLEEEHELKQKQLEQEKRKLKELEEKRLREKRRLEEDKQRQLEKQHLEHLKKICLQKAEQEKEVLLNSIIEQEVAKIAQEEQQKYETFKQASQLQSDLLLDEVTLSIVKDITHEEYAIMCYDQMLLNRYFNRWLKHLRKKREHRKLMESTPIWVTTDTRAQFAEALEHPCQLENLEMIKRYRLGQSCDFKQLIQMGHHSPGYKHLKPLCLFRLVGRHLWANCSFTPSGLLQQRRYFKFLISIPSDKEELPGFETYCNKWLFKNIKKAQLETGPFVHGLEHNLALCVRKLSGIYPKNEQGDEIKGEGDHSDGVVYFLSGEDYPSQARRRLYNLLYISKNYKNLPVAIIAYNCFMEKHEIAEMLDLDSLEEEGLLFKYKIIGNTVSRKDFSMRKAFIDAINFVTFKSYKENFADVQALAMENIIGFLDSTLGEEIWQRWHESANINPVFQKICQDPQYVEGIYHKALQNVIQITQEDFTELPEFPEELKEFVPQEQQNLKGTNIPLGLEFFPPNWKAMKTKKLIYNFLKNLYLPSDIDSSLPTKVDEMKIWILNYATKCLNNEEIAIKAAHTAIEQMINQLQDPLLKQLKVEERLKHLNYLSILKPIIFFYINENLRQFHFDLKDAAIIYIRNDLKTYQTQPWWLNYQPLNLVNMDYTTFQAEAAIEDSSVEDSKENEISTQDLNDIIAKAEQTSRVVEENLIALKQKKYLHRPQASANNQCLNLKRTMDESIYKFELSKKIGLYDTSFADNLTHPVDMQQQENVNESSNVMPEMANKRIRLSLNDSVVVGNEETTSASKEIDDVIAKAMELIKKVESMEECKGKQKATNITKIGIR